MGKEEWVLKKSTQCLDAPDWCKKNFKEQIVVIDLWHFRQRVETALEVKLDPWTISDFDATKPWFLSFSAIEQTLGPFLVGD